MGKNVAKEYILDTASRERYMSVTTWYYKDVVAPLVYGLCAWEFSNRWLRGYYGSGEKCELIHRLVMEKKGMKFVNKERIISDTQ